MCGVRRVGAVMARRGPAVLIARLVVRAAARAWFAAIGRVSRASAVGVSWTSRTTSAEWAARYGHTSVIDAAGAIYVIGGNNGGAASYNDVWASTDGGAGPDYGKGKGRLRVGGGVLPGTPWGLRY